MANFKMKGFFELTREKIDEEVTRKSAGNYLLGYMEDRVFYVKYVGRADSDVNDRIKDWVDSYKEFIFSYAPSPKAAFEKECEDYHDFGEAGKLDNKIHPDRPEGASWKCPKCNNFD